jgi:SAM-dependent methyltransferase
MGRMLSIVSPLHKATKRDYLARMADEKVHCMIKAKEYEFDYWDGERRYGYGGYKYIPGRWKPVAEQLVQIYDLKAGSRVLDIGCGKAHLLYELSKLVPGIEVRGIDTSKHGIAEAPEEIRGELQRHRAEDVLPFGDKSFDLVISLATLHNLKIFDLKAALQEVERVGRQKYIMVEGYRNEQELFGLECWALTAQAFFHTSEWVWLFKEFGYTGDYEVIYFE